MWPNDKITGIPPQTSPAKIWETGLDYFGFRYMSAAQGRFTSPDPIVVTPARMLDPQRFNLYVYGRNNPLKFVDLDGRDAYLANNSEEERRKALYSITKNLSTREQRNIGHRKNAQGKYELDVKDASKINLSKASEGYQQLVTRINERTNPVTEPGDRRTIPVRPSPSWMM